MKIREQDKHFLWSLFQGIGFIFTFKGMWLAVYEIPYLGDPWVALFVGLTVLTLSGLIFREFDPLGGLEKSINKKMGQIHSHSQKKEFKVKYYDKNKKKEILLDAENFIRIEKNNLLFKQDGQEFFLPMHRLMGIVHRGKYFWRI